MFSNSTLFKSILTVGVCIIVVFLFIKTLQDKDRPEVKAATLKTSNTRPSTATQYASPLNAEQVNAINSIKTLPKPSIKPIPTEIPPPSETPSANNSGRCIYNKQTYALGDIVKTDKGWIRCTPTLSFSPDKPTLPQSDRPAWTTIQ